MDGFFALSFFFVIFGSPPFVVGLLIGWYARGRRSAAATEMAVNEARRLDALVDQVRHDAYQHLSLDSTLAPIIVDTIRSSDLERDEAFRRSKVAPATVFGDPNPLGAQQARAFLDIDIHQPHVDLSDRGTPGPPGLPGQLPPPAAHEPGRAGPDGRPGPS